MYFCVISFVSLKSEAHSGFSIFLFNFYEKLTWEIERHLTAVASLVSTQSVTNSQTNKLTNIFENIGHLDYECHVEHGNHTDCAITMVVAQGGAR